MTFLLQLAYYVLLVISTLIGGFYFVMTLLDLPQRIGTSQIRENLVVLTAFGAALGMLYWAFRLGHQQGEWGAALLTIGAAVLVFAILFAVGMLLFVKMHWQ